MADIWAKLQGFKTILGVLVWIVYSWASTHGIVAKDPTIEAALMGWIALGIGSKIDRAGA
jgi:hypothetical protein